MIDEDKLTRWSLGEALRQEGYSVGEASSWEEALSQAGTTEFRLILADVEIHDEQSLSGLRALRGLQPSAAILVLSSDRADQTEEALQPLGRFQVIEKPYGLEAVKSFVRDALGDKARRGEQS